MKIAEYKSDSSWFFSSRFIYAGYLLDFTNQVMVRLVIYFDQQIMKDFTIETSNITTHSLELSPSLVCITDVPSNISNESMVHRDTRGSVDRGLEQDEYIGIGNMVRLRYLKQINFFFQTVCHLPASLGVAGVH